MCHIDPNLDGINQYKINTLDQDILNTDIYKLPAWKLGGSNYVMQKKFSSYPYTIQI